jgi:hypothetical protein
VLYFLTPVPKSAIRYWTVAFIDAKINVIRDPAIPAGKHQNCKKLALVVNMKSKC